jgi:alanyl-tRNA synthetase
METIKLYDEFPYETHFTANVLSCTKVNDYYDIVLDQTLFFPTGGGQCCDIGTINNIAVNDVQIIDEVIHHYCKEKLEGEVNGEINFDLRFSNMQNHSGEHILSGIVHSLFGYDNVGFHLGNDEVTVDFNGKLTDEDILMLERKVNEVIYQNVNIICSYPDDISNINYRSKKEIEGKIRIVEIEGIDICACCAPHVRKSGEIGLFKVKRWMNYKKGVRLFIVCGKRAFEYFLNTTQQLSYISHLLSAPIDKCDNYVQKLYDDQEKLKQEINEIKKQAIEEKCKQLDHKETYFIVEEDLTPANQRYYANILLEKCQNACIFVGKNNQYKFFIASLNDATILLNELKQQFIVRGGGKKDSVQGSIEGNIKDIERIVMGGE